MKPLLRYLRRKLWILLGKDIRPKIQIKLKGECYGSDYGGWTVLPELINPESIIYSFGVGEDASWDLAMIETFKVTIHAFDPTPKSIQWIQKQKFPDQFIFHPYGLAAIDGEVSFNPPENPEHVSHTILDRPQTRNQAIKVPVFKLSTIMKKLGHQKIDILKMDIEGAEYQVIEDLLQSGISVKQLLIEFHHRFPNVGVRKTKDAIKLLNDASYAIMAVSRSGEEYTFIKTPIH